MVNLNLSEKIVLVIGSASGIGQSISETFLNESRVVIEADIKYSDLFEKVTNQHYRCHVDLKEESSINSLFKTLEENNLIPNCLIHVAGISTLDYLVDSQTKDFDITYEINTKAVYLTIKQISNYWIGENQQGKIIVIASQAGKNPYQGMSAYVTSKHAVLGLVKTAALELAQYQILVNAICPGIIETKMKERERIEGAKIRNISSADILAEDISQVPLGRIGLPKDVANVAVFLASDLANYMTGQSINVTGGMTMN